jgi:hypothetical protein
MTRYEVWNANMTKTVTVDVPHKLGKDEARSRLAFALSSSRNQLAGSIISALVTKERWDGDRVYFEEGCCPKIGGHADVLADSVRIQVDLPDMPNDRAQRVADLIKRKMQKRLMGAPPLLACTPNPPLPLMLPLMLPRLAGAHVAWIDCIPADCDFGRRC